MPRTRPSRQRLAGPAAAPAGGGFGRRPPRAGIERPDSATGADDGEKSKQRGRGPRGRRD
eukprot:5076945-Pyramimonas_sp.AAC.2